MSNFETSFTFLKSIHTRMDPSGLRTMMGWLRHWLCEGSITPSVSMASTSSSKILSRWYGLRRRGRQTTLCLSVVMWWVAKCVSSGLAKNMSGNFPGASGRTLARMRKTLWKPGVFPARQTTKGPTIVPTVGGSHL